MDRILGEDPRYHELLEAALSTPLPLRPASRVPNFDPTWHSTRRACAPAAPLEVHLNLRNGRYRLDID